MYCSCAQLYVLFFHILWLSVSVAISELSTTTGPILCGGEYRNVEVGEIISPVNVSDLQVTVCTWILSAPPGKKLLVNIDHVEVSGRSHAILALYVDGEEIATPQACDNCRSNIVGVVLKATLELMPTNFTETIAEEDNATNIVNLNESDVTFLISYKSFDPHKCDRPESPSNGYYVEKGLSIGSMIRYFCYPPYEPVGNSKSTCVATGVSPIPVWEDKPPHCAIPPCNGLVLSRTAGKGMIVHPGYPAKTVLSGQHCEWHVRTNGFRQVVANIKFFSLPLGEKKRKNGGTYLAFYDGSHDNLMLRLRGQENARSLTTTSNHLIIVLQTDNVTLQGNDASDTFGFYVEYASTCEPLSAPLNGNVTSLSLTVGSNASFQCNEGFELEGSSVLVCLLDASWSSSPPICHFLGFGNTTFVNSTIVSTNHSEFPVDDYDDDEGDDNDGPSTSTASFSAMTSELGTSPVVFTSLNDSSAAEFTVAPLIDATSPSHENVPFTGKGNRKSDVPSHQDANGKSYITKTNKEDETGKTSSAGQSNGVHHTKQLEKHRENPVVLSDFLIILIASAVSISVVLGLVLLGACLWYRKQYPVRMNFGRKFETFENPIYQTRGKKTSSSPPTVPENPAELQRLTAARLSL